MHTECYSPTVSTLSSVCYAHICTALIIPGISPTACPLLPKPAMSTSSFSSMKLRQPSRGTKAVIFLPFLISCTRMHFRIAELGCLASTPLKGGEERTYAATHIRTYSSSSSSKNLYSHWQQNGATQIGWGCATTDTHRQTHSSTIYSAYECTWQHLHFLHNDALGVRGTSKGVGLHVRETMCLFIIFRVPPLHATGAAHLARRAQPPGLA